MATANKRVSGQCPLWFPFCSPEDLSSSGSSTSRTGDNNKKLVVNDIDDTPETLFLTKGATSMAVQDRKIAIAACEAKAVGEKEERSISCAEAKAARAVSKVDEPHPKMVEAINGTTVPTPPGRLTAPEVSISHQFQPHRIPGLSSPVQPLAGCSQPSPQQQSATANKRVSVQSFLWFLFHSPKDLSSSESSTSVSGEDDEILLGKVTDDEIKTPFGAKGAKAIDAALLLICFFPLTLILTKRAEGFLAPSLQSILRRWPSAVPAGKHSNRKHKAQVTTAKDTNNKTESPFSGLAKCRNSLSQGNPLEACRGSRYVSPLACGLLVPKPAGWQVTSQAEALQQCECNESLLFYNGSWMDDDSDAEGCVNEIAFSNKDDDKGPATLLPVCPTTLLNDVKIPVSHQMERDAASISNGIWPGSHNIILLTRFVACYPAGDWNSYLFFAQGADSKSLENFSPLFEWTTGILFNPTAGIHLFRCPLLLRWALWEAGLRSDPRTWVAIL